MIERQLRHEVQVNHMHSSLSDTRCNPHNTMSRCVPGKLRTFYLNRPTISQMHTKRLKWSCLPKLIELID
jgi:hypothetical protein